MKRMISCILMCIILTGCNNTGVTSSETADRSSSSSNPTTKELVIYLNDNEIPSLYATPNKYIGKYVKLTGQIFNIQTIDGGFAFQLYQDVANKGRNTVVVYSGMSNIKMNDFVSIDGKVTDVFTGTNAFGAPISAPQIEAKSVDIVPYEQVAAPALKTIEVGETKSQHGYEVTIDKIELAKTETRVFVTVKNNGDGKFSLYPFNVSLIQDQHQYKEQLNFEADYPDLQTSMIPGTVSSGVICFPMIDLNAPLKINMPASSDNYKIKIQDFVFDIENN